MKRKTSDYSMINKIQVTNFGLYVVKETGETRLLADSEFPLLLRFVHFS